MAIFISVPATLEFAEIQPCPAGFAFYLRGDRPGGAALMERRVQDFGRLHPRCTFDHIGQHRDYIFVRLAVIQVCVFLRVPQTARKYLCAAGGGKRDFVLKSLLLAEQGNDFLLKSAGKFGELIGLQLN